MTIRFEHAEIEALLTELETTTHRGREEVLLDALRRERERAEQYRAQQRREAIASAQLLRDGVNARPIVDPRPIDEILAYDENGLPV